MPELVHQRVHGVALEQATEIVAYRKVGSRQPASGDITVGGMSVDYDPDIVTEIRLSGFVVHQSRGTPLERKHFSHVEMELIASGVIYTLDLEICARILHQFVHLLENLHSATVVGHRLFLHKHLAAEFPPLKTVKLDIPVNIVTIWNIISVLIDLRKLDLVGI